ncbi:hypothetical protein A9Q99_20485 [Gammaproteobacteria bacterium 45_16_T64]|nr:hypothetical protein A9Q99_20485 [Gammaproteobacteria bacterium 45_16_T64]
MLRNTGLFMLLLLMSSLSWAHYPVLNCHLSQNPTSGDTVICSASFSDKSLAPNVVIEVYSEDDEVVSQGRTNDDSSYRFNRPQGAFFILMDAGPGHALEISNEEVTGL